MPASSDMLAAKRIVLVGGGHAHALVLKAWAGGRAPRTRVTLVSPARHTPYSGMLPGHVAGHYGWDAFHIDLEALARAAGATLVLDRCAGLDLDAGRVLLERGAPLPFDLVSLDTGSTAEPPGALGRDGRLVPVKPLAPFLEAWRAALASNKSPTVAVVGAGVGGAELALAMARRLDGAGRVRLLERGPSIVPELPAAARRSVRAALGELGVEVVEGADVRAVDAAGLVLDGGRTVGADLAVAAAGARAPAWLAETGLALAADGFVRVDATLRSVSDPRVFAAGDVAHLDHAPRPKAGVFAVRQGPLLARSLEAVAAGGAPVRYMPQADYLRLVSLGHRRALAIKHGRTLGGAGAVGALLWRLKDRIDRSFMAGIAAG